jgi:DnaK suppressor protein
MKSPRGSFRGSVEAHGLPIAARQDEMARKSTTSPSSTSPGSAGAAKVTGKSAKAAPEKAAKAPAKAPAKAAKPAGAKTAPKNAEKTAAQAEPVVVGPSDAERAEFLASQRQLLLDERSNYIHSAEVLKAQADSLALEHEPGDVQFDEEGGEGGTSNVDRELDLVLSAQARAAAAEIDRALAKIESGTYGFCEQCGQQIPDARLQALPQAALCVACKSGGLSSRR